jgi:hypothetical protein
MQSANLGDRHYAPEGWGLHRAGSRSILLERLMRARGVVVGHVGAQESAEMGRAQDDEMIQALAAKGADDPLDKRVLPGRARGDADLVDPHPLLIRRANSSP